MVTLTSPVRLNDLVAAWSPIPLGRARPQALEGHDTASDRDWPHPPTTTTIACSHAASRSGPRGLPWTPADTPW
jgi:hypothetical protein